MFTAILMHPIILLQGIYQLFSLRSLSHCRVPITKIKRIIPKKLKFN